MDIDHLRRKRQKSVQQQNALLKYDIQRCVGRWLSDEKLPIPIEDYIAEQGYSRQNALLVRYHEGDPRLQMSHQGLLLTNEQVFIDFEFDLDFAQNSIEQVLQFGVTDIEVNAHLKGRGKSFGHLCIEVLQETRETEKKPVMDIVEVNDLKLLTQSKYRGCFLGLAAGDAYGAPFEGGPLERLAWKLLGKTRSGQFRYTDDTQMSIDTAESFLACKTIDQSHLASTYANSYRWSRGYGPSAAKLLKKVRRGAHWQEVNRGRYPEGSYGNGAAMRAPILALCKPYNFTEFEDYVLRCSEITHAHPTAINGALLVAETVRLGLLQKSTSDILHRLDELCVRSELKSRLEVCRRAINTRRLLTDSEIRLQLGNGIAAKDSCITAIYLALVYRDNNFTDVLENARRLGGDVDTIGAMSGAIWGAINGDQGIDQDKIDRFENRNRITELADSLFSLTQQRITNTQPKE